MSFKSAYECGSLEEFVLERCRIKFEKGRRGILKEDLRKIAEDRNIKLKSSLSRDEMFDTLFENGVTAMDLYELHKNHFYVKAFDYYERFDLTKSEMDRLKRRDFFEIVGYDLVDLYGRCVRVPQYSPEQFFNVTREDIDEALKSKVKKKK